MKITINEKEYNVKVAETDEDFDYGLQGITTLPENEGMLFPMEEEEETIFSMKDTQIALDIIFINDEDIVTNIFKGHPGSIEEFEGIAKNVLELNIDSGVSIGDEVEFDEDLDDIKIKTMHVLDEHGNSQMEIEGGERIFSRKNTKTLIKMAKRAYKNDTDRYYKALGKKAFQYLDVQDTNDAEYVELP